MPDALLFERFASQWQDLWPTLSGLALLVVHLFASGHAVLKKAEVRAAIGWVGVIWLVPLVGPALYLLLGINRISRRATALRGAPRPRTEFPRALPEAERDTPPAHVTEHLSPLVSMVEGISELPLLEGNHVVPLFDGDSAYGAMVAAIAAAKHTVALSTYIFDVDQAGKPFVAALADAHRRGVQVRVLIDDAGARYSVPRARTVLRREGVRTALFMPALSPLSAPYINLRNHRKLVIVDGETAFTGGMNIRKGHLAGATGRGAIRDVHFEVRGPVVDHLRHVFADDWRFATRERLSGPGWFPPLQPAGKTTARGIVDGPDDNFEALHWTLLGAIACARQSIRVMTPYFLPDQSLLTALDVAAMRGVEVQVVVPEHVNIKPVQWAMWAQFDQVVERGCQLHLSRGSFDHSKLMVVDDTWALVGSANWDARSLRLNFEFCLECYDPALCAELSAHIDRQLDNSHQVTRADLAGRGLPARLRDGFFRLFSPYL